MNRGSFFGGTIDAVDRTCAAAADVLHMKGSRSEPQLHLQLRRGEGRELQRGTSRERRHRAMPEDEDEVVERPEKYRNDEAWGEDRAAAGECYEDEDIYEDDEEEDEGEDEGGVEEAGEDDETGGRGSDDDDAIAEEYESALEAARILGAQHAQDKADRNLVLAVVNSTSTKLPSTSAPAEKGATTKNTKTAKRKKKKAKKGRRRKNKKKGGGGAAAPSEAIAFPGKPAVHGRRANPEDVLSRSDRDHVRVLSWLQNELERKHVGASRLMSLMDDNRSGTASCKEFETGLMGVVSQR